MTEDALREYLDTLAESALSPGERSLIAHLRTVCRLLHPDEIFRTWEIGCIRLPNPKIVANVKIDHILAQSILKPFASAGIYQDYLTLALRDYLSPMLDWCGNRGVEALLLTREVATILSKPTPIAGFRFPDSASAVEFRLRWSDEYHISFSPFKEVA